MPPALVRYITLGSIYIMCVFPLESVYCVENATLYMEKEKHRGFSSSFFSCSPAVSVYYLQNSLLLRN